jgi:hypothetical protein
MAAGALALGGISKSCVWRTEGEHLFYRLKLISLAVANLAASLAARPVAAIKPMPGAASPGVAGLNFGIASRAAQAGLGSKSPLLSGKPVSPALASSTTRNRPGWVRSSYQNALDNRAALSDLTASPDDLDRDESTARIAAP